MKAEIVGGIVVADGANEGADERQIVREQTTVDFVSEELAEDAAEVFVPGIAEERTGIGQHSNEPVQQAELRNRFELAFHAIHLIVEPPSGAHLDFSGDGGALEAAGERHDKFVVAGVQGVEDGSGKEVLPVERIEDFCERGGDVPVSDGIGAGVGAVDLEESRAIVPDDIEMELPCPVCPGIHFAAEDQKPGAETGLFIRRRGFSAARLFEDGGHFGSGAGLGEYGVQSVIGEAAVVRGEEVVAFLEGPDKIVEGGDGLVCGGGEAIDPFIPSGRIADGKSAIRAPSGEDTHMERVVLCNGFMEGKRIDRIVCRADGFDMGGFHETAGGKAVCFADGFCAIPDGLGRIAGKQKIVNAEVSRQFEVAPVVHGIAKRMRHGLGEFLEFFASRGISGDEFLGNSIGAHDAPLVVVGSQPSVCDISPAPIFCDFRGGKMAMVVDDWKRFRVFVIKNLRRAGGQQKIRMDELHGESKRMGIG